MPDAVLRYTVSCCGARESHAHFRHFSSFVRHNRRGLAGTVLVKGGHTSLFRRFLANGTCDWGAGTLGPTLTAAWRSESGAIESAQMTDEVPYANYQYEIYLRGMTGQRPARTLDWRKLEQRRDEPAAARARGDTSRAAPGWARRCGRTARRSTTGACGRGCCATSPRGA